jgi:hypothetical protein
VREGAGSDGRQAVAHILLDDVVNGRHASRGGGIIALLVVVVGGQRLLAGSLRNVGPLATIHEVDQHGIAQAGAIPGALTTAMAGCVSIGAFAIWGFRAGVGGDFRRGDGERRARRRLQVDLLGL